jgi:hypothetical protein
MTLIIEVSNELEARIEEAAKRNGLAKAEVVRLALEEKFNLTESPRNPPFEARITATNLPVPDRSREHTWLEKHRDEFAGQRVVLDGDNLIAAGFDGKDVAKKVRELGINGTYLVFVEGSDQPRFISGGVW